MRTYTGAHATRGTVGPPDDAGRSAAATCSAHARDSRRDPGRRHRRDRWLRASSQRLGNCRLRPHRHAEHDGCGLRARLRRSGQAHVRGAAQSPGERSIRAGGTCRMPPGGVSSTGGVDRLISSSRASRYRLTPSSGWLTRMRPRRLMRGFWCMRQNSGARKAPALWTDCLGSRLWVWTSVHGAGIPRTS
jgi:hypothetical protein